MLTPSPPRPPHGHAVAARAAARRRALAAAFAAGAAAATLALVWAGYRVGGGDGTGGGHWAPRAASAAPPRSNPLARLALDGDGAAVEAPGSSAPSRTVIGTAVIPLARAEDAAAAEVVIVAASPDAARGLLGTAADSMPGLRLLVRGVGNGVVNATAATLRNDGVRAARGTLFTILDAGVRLLPGYWEAVARAAESGQAAFYYTGGLMPGTTTTPSAEDWRVAPPWTNPLPPATAVRRAAWAAAGGYPETPAGGEFADTLLAGVAAERLPGGLSTARAADVALYDDAGAPPRPDVAGSTAALVDAAAAVATCGAPLTPVHVLRAHELIFDGGAADAGLLAAVLDAASAAAATPGLACPAAAQADLLAGLGREAAGRLDDAQAAYARAARCARRARVPALAWAASLRADAARTAALRRCVARSGAAAEPGDRPRPVKEGAKADAAECVELMLGEVV